MRLTKNRTPSIVLSNNGLCLRAAAQHALLFLVLAVNSGVTRSYSSRPFLCALGLGYRAV